MFMGLFIDHISEEQASRMDFREENTTQKDMLEKIAELDYSRNHLRDLNAKMRHWLDVADDDMAGLRSENAALSQQVKNLEKIISEAEKDEAEPCRSLLADELYAKRWSETEIQALEEEYATIQEKYKELSNELKNLKQERYKEKVNLSQLKDELQSLELRLEDSQLGLQHRDEAIDQKNMQLQLSEETVEECSSIIKELRLTNQELRMQLEDRMDEASYAVLKDVVREKEGPLSPPLSFAEEMRLLASSPEEEIIISDSTDIEHEETGAEELLMPQSFTVDCQTKSPRCACTLGTALQRAGIFLLFIFILTVLLFVASRNHVGNLFSIDIIWNSACLMLQPYWGVRYEALPPI
ncbi:uncharacterized protein LOC117817374 isoform X2 [Notolabrus celidotus]|uniref:uncharacterized protein LOC117817374 isoform X2 n=2 Tax=Notolabrus celidotus TaxID=1203425 RepID=UPI0014905704|nr:uncharacterized protein LOC117817374 isoform X2 [Notolabrus celidotus]